MLVNLVLFSTFFVGLVYCVKKFLSHRSSAGNLPPGPLGWPVLGNLNVIMGSDRHERIRTIGEQYGGIFTMTVGIRKTVWLTKYRLVREAVIKHSWEFAGRPQEAPKMNDLHEGILSSGVNENEKEVRRFTLVTLRNYGFGKTSMQDTLLQEASNLVDVFKRKLGTPFNPRSDLTSATGNVISGMLMGKQFDGEDVGFRSASESITEGLKLVPKANLEIAFPALRWFNDTKRKMKYHFGVAEAFLQDIINQHVSSRVPDKPRDFIDAWLDQEAKSKQGPAFLRKNLPNVVGDIFAGGFETTATSFQWLFAMLLNHPAVQDRIHAELDEAVGKDTQVTLDHRDLLVYTEAVILETQRMYPLVPFAAPHMCTKDATIGGYLLTKGDIVWEMAPKVLPSFDADNNLGSDIRPAEGEHYAAKLNHLYRDSGTPVILHIYSVLHDPELWDQPADFRPERFITDGKLMIPEYFLAFSAGRRSCIGEQLARKELFLFFANIMQNFNIVLPKGAETPSLEKHDGFVTYPLPFDIVVIPR